MPNPAALSLQIRFGAAVALPSYAEVPVHGGDAQLQDHTGFAWQMTITALTPHASKASL